MNHPTSLPRRIPARRVAARRIAPSILALFLGIAACDAIFPDDGEAIDRDTFIEAQVELRLAALDAGTQELSPGERDRVLAEEGVTDEELQAFIAVHGTDEAFMTDVWTEVDRRVLEALGAEPEEFPDPSTD